MINRVDIIITTRNRISELRITLDKMLSMGFSQDQVYIIDDASTDGTTTEVKETYPGISVVTNAKSRGLIANRNTLMFSTTRDFVMSLDDDSHVRTGNDIEDALVILDSDRKAGIFTFRPFEQIAEPPAKESLSQKTSAVRTYIGCGHIIKRDLLNQLGKYKEEFEFYCEEIDYSLRAFRKGYSVIMKDDLVVHHRIDWSFREAQFQSDLSKGVYGAVWRSKLGFSNNLCIPLLHFPFPFDVVFLIRYIFIRMYYFLFRRKDVKGFFLGLARFLRMIPFCLRNRTALPYGMFFKWIKLKSI